MSDNIRATPSTGTTGALFASDEMVDPLGSTDVVHVPLTKLVYGVANSGTPVSTNNPWPVTVLASTIITANVTNTVVVNVTNTVTANVTNTVVCNVTNTVVVDSELPAAAALSDNAGNPTAPAVAAHLMVWDSTAWDRLLGSSVDGVLVNLGANNDVTIASTVNVSGSTVHLGTGTNNIGTVHNSSVTVSNVVTVNSTGGVYSVSGSTVSVSGSTVSVSGSSVTLNGVTTDAGLPVRIMGSTTLSVSGSTISVSGSTVSVSGSTVSVSGSSVTLNGVTTDAGLPVRIMGSTTLSVSGSTLSVSGSTVSVSGSTLSVSGSTVSVINGSTFLVQPQAYTSGGADPYSFLTTTAAVSTGVPVKASAGQVYTVDMFNTSSTPVYVRLYNQTTTPASTDDANIKWRGIVPGSTAGAGFVKAWPLGLAFGTGIGIRWSAGIADTDTTVLTSSPTYGNVGYK